MHQSGLRRLWFKLVNWEAWHYHIKYIPIAPVWLWYCLKARSFWFFTASNPTITFGGFEGEGKEEIYKQMPEGTYPESIFIQPHENFESVKSQIKNSNIQLPFVVKPDIGAMGFLFRKIDSIEQLQKYHSFIGEKYIIQEWIDYKKELSVFYYRMPNKKKGVITGMLMKEPPTIKGDGRSTIAELVYNDDVLKNNFHNISQRHVEVLDEVLPAGKKMILSHASNRSQGGILRNLNHEIDEKICRIFDEISLHSKGFFYGRFDIKCNSLESLREGRDFSILEYNGSGAGVQHIYGDNLSLYRACKMIVHHWEKLYQISRFNNKNKQVKYWRFTEGRKFLANAMQHLKKLKVLDEKFPV